MINVNRLLDVYDKHGTIIIGVDFDDTIFPLSECLSAEEVKKIIWRRRLLKVLKPYLTICLYTATDNQSLKYKLELMKLWEIEPDFINESPVVIGDGKKPYFNILLDDKAGLKEIDGKLIQLKFMIKNRNK